MTVSANSRVQTYSGSGSTGPFTFNFRVLSSSHVSVTRVAANGTRTSLIAVTDYAITLTALGQSGGSITLTSALLSGQTLVIEGNAPLTQPTSYSNQGRFYPETHETSYDRLTILVQELNEVVSRALAVNPEVSGVSLILPNPVADKYLSWNSTGTAIVNRDGADEEFAIQAAASAAAAAASASTATTQAGIATTQAGIATAAAASLNLPTIASNPYKHLQVKADGTGYELVISYDLAGVFIEGNAENKTYDILLNVPFKCQIYEVYSKCASGTATATVKINGVALGGSANSVSSSEQVQSHSSAYTVNPGDDITVTFSSVSSCVDARVNANFRRVA